MVISRMFWLHLCSEACLELGVVLGGVGPLGGLLPHFALVTEEVGDAFAIFGDFLIILFFIAMSLAVVEPSSLETSLSFCHLTWSCWLNHWWLLRPCESSKGLHSQQFLSKENSKQTCGHQNNLLVDASWWCCTYTSLA
jgi:hypothetical protein